MGKNLLLFLFFTFSFLPDGSSQSITTIAGNGFNAKKGYGGYSGDGGLAINAELYFPSDVIFDKAGNMYIAEGNSRIRKVAASTGIITTIAGNGVLGWSGNEGPATDAELSYPTGLALDAAGNIYIADIFNNEVREVNLSTGIITLIAGNGYKALSNNGGYIGNGGPAELAELNAPEGIAFDVAGNIYIADCNNNAIRKVSKSTGIITTVAGNGSKGFVGDGGPATDAELNGPSSLVIDSHNNMYIADRDNNLIRKVSLSTGYITTVAGNSSEGYAGDGRPATDASLNGPRNIALDGAGNMYIADFYNNVVRKVSQSTGIISTVTWAGMKGTVSTGKRADSAIFFQPACAVPSASGYLYIADEGNNVIRKVALPKEKKLPAKSLPLAKTNDGIVYKIQLLATRNKLSEGIIVAGTKEKASVDLDNGVYKYSAGCFTNFRDAVKYLKQLRAMGYDDLFISASEDKNSVKSSQLAMDNMPSYNNFTKYDSVVYKVQVLATRNRLEEGVTVAGTHTGTSVNTDASSYGYATGCFTNFSDAINYEDRLKAMGYTDAFIRADERVFVQPSNPVADISNLH
jgi:sugar lactone lactonase YvrE